MVAIHPRAPAWCDKLSTRVPEDVADVTSATTDSSAIPTLESTTWLQFLPQPNISNSIVLSKLRFLFTVISLVLLITDIPRTGLGIRNLHEYYPLSLMPSTAVRFGPFAYPVAHIWRLDNNSNESPPEFAGLKGTKSISTARAWPYQFDTLSVGLRGVVELLNVTEYPGYLLYKPEAGQQTTNGESLFDLSTAFTMLDALITAAHSKLRPTNSGKTTTLRFATKHNWVDRIHHYVVRFASTTPAWRLHSLHVPQISRNSQSLGVCSVTKYSSLRPRFCNHPGMWKCSHPLDASLPAVRLWDHMDLRFQSLRQRYPGLNLDVIWLSSQRLSSTSGALRSTYYNYEAHEVTVLTRGKQCSETKTNSTTQVGVTTCTTVFVDDFRYERDTVQTNLVEWYPIIAFLRGGAQAYVWGRLLLLIYGAYSAVGHEKSGSSSRLMSTLSIVFKIPFEVIVYSSLLPVCGYVIAQLLDSSFMDIFLDSYWAAVGGSIKINLVTFLRSTAVQMRNVWLLALLVPLTVFVVRKPRDYWGESRPAIRGLVISFTSTLTVFGPYKKTTLRDTNIINLFLLPDEGQTMDIVHSNSVHFNISNYFFDVSAIMLIFCIGAVIGLAAAIKVLNSVILQSYGARREARGFILSSTTTVPCGTNRLWQTSVLSVQFVARQRLPVVSQSNPSQVIYIEVAGLHKAPLQTKVTPFQSLGGASLKSSSQMKLLGDLRYNSTEFRSIVQLMNIAMMTDPWNFVWLRVFGIHLYLYRIRVVPSATSSCNLQFYVIILPYAADEMEEHTGFCAKDFQLLASASSRDVPMSTLLLSG